MYRSNGIQTQFGHSAAVPTPAPTVTSCISDEDVAIQLMRLGNVNAGSNTTSTVDDCRDGFISDCGEYGDDGRSDTTELPDPLPSSSQDNLPDSPILYPKGQKFKSLDEILPSFDTTEPSDDENQPPDQSFSVPHPSHHSHQSQHTSHLTAIRPARAPSDYEEDNLSDEGDETYIAKEESDHGDADYEDDLDDVPLKMRRERKMSAAPIMNFKPKQPLSKGIAKVIKRQPMSLPSKPRPLVKPQSEPHYPISPASPPSSRKPSVASSGGNKSRSNTMQHGPGAPFSLDQPQLFTSFGDQLPIEEPRPRCQRCRKSKKGCDRQRPCQRCKDAGIPPEQCISEDEAGTRRGRQAAAAAKKAGMANGMLKPKAKKKKKV